MTKIYFFTVLFFGYFASAEDCNNEMTKFKISEDKVKQICKEFSSPKNFSNFKNCVFSTAKMFNKLASDEEIYSTPGSDLNGIFSTCSAGKVRDLEAPRNATPAAQK